MVILNGLNILIMSLLSITHANFYSLKRLVLVNLSSTIGTVSETKKPCRERINLQGKKHTQH